MKSLHSALKILALALLFCADLAISKEKKASYSWEPVLKTINVSPLENGEQKASYPAAVDLDLLNSYASELRVLEDSWAKEKQKLPSADVKEAREKKNTFFHLELSRENTAMFSKLADSASEKTSAKKDYRKIAERVLAEVERNPVAKLESVQSFDQGGQIGFCFGRAFLVHYLLLKEGVPQADISKIFVLGQLLVERKTWNFHVAVLLKDAAAGFLVVDPLQKEPMELKKWAEINAGYEVKGRLSRARFYVTDPRKFLPSFGIYSKDLLEKPALKDYFRKLRETL